MKSIKTILSHDKNVAKFLSSEFSVCIRDCQFVKHGLRPANCIQSSLRSLFMRLLLVKHGLRPANCIQSSLRSLFMRLRIKTKKICLQASLQQIFFVLILVLQIILYCGAFCVSGGACFEEVCFYHIGIGVLRYPLHGFRLFLIARIKGSEA